MTLRFTETAPGVHTSSILNAKTGKSHNIAIIESSESWQLFIDGELSVRDLPSFKAAVSAAEAKLKSPGTSLMVRAACGLVIASIAGASLIGATKLFGSILQEPVLASEIQTQPATTKTSERFKRVTPKLSQPETATAPAPSTKLINAVTTPAQQPVIEQAIAVAPAAPESRRFSAENPALAAKAAPVPASIATSAKPVVEPTPQPEIQPAAPAATPVKYENTSQPAATELPSDPAQENSPVTGDETLTPILPTKAPLIARPLIRPQTTILPQSLLAEIERSEAGEKPNRIKPARQQIERAVPTRATATFKGAQTRKAKSQNAESRHDTRRETNRRWLKAERTRARSKQARIRAKHRSTSERYSRTANTTNHYRTAEIYRATPAPRMVCFAHSCKFR